MVPIGNKFIKHYSYGKIYGDAKTLSSMFISTCHYPALCQQLVSETVKTLIRLNLSGGNCFHRHFFVSTIKVLNIGRSPCSSVGYALAYSSSGLSSIPARGEVFSSVNGAPLPTVFHYQPVIVLI